MADHLDQLIARQDCGSGTLFYTCALNSFRGCCSVDPCSLTEGCPDSPSSTASTTRRSTTTASASTSTSPQATGSPIGPVILTRTQIQTVTSFTNVPSTSGSSISIVAYTSGGSIITTTVTSQITATSSPDTSSHPPSSPAVPIGAIVGAVIGGLVLILLVLLFIYLRRRKRRENSYYSHQTRASVSSLGAFWRPHSHRPSSATHDSPPYTPSLFSFLKRDSKAVSTAHASPVSQIDGFPISTSHRGHAAELPDTSGPVELPGDRPA